MSVLQIVVVVALIVAMDRITSRTTMVSAAGGTIIPSARSLPTFTGRGRKSSKFD